MQVNTILFDWDGTVAQTLEIWLDTFKQASNKVGIELTALQIGELFGNWEAVKTIGVSSKDKEIFLAEINSVHEKLRKVSLYPGAERILKSLKTEGYKIGLITSSDRKMLESVSSFKENSKVFDTVITAEDVKKHKPDPEALYIAMNRLGTDSKRSVFVGDSVKDAGAAKNANVAMMLFAPSTHSTFYNLHELKKHKAVCGVFADWSNFPYNLIRS